MHLTVISHVYDKAHYLQGTTIKEYAFIEYVLKRLSQFKTAIYQTAVRFLQQLRNKE